MCLAQGPQRSDAGEDTTLTVTVATLSVNKLIDSWQYIQQVLYSVDTNGCSSNV